MSGSQTPKEKMIKVRYGKLYLAIYDSASKKLVRKQKVTKITELEPIIIICETRDYYIRGLGVLLETESGDRYCFQLISLHAYADPEHILSLYNYNAIVDCKIYGKIIGVVRGWKIHDSEYKRVIFAEGSKLIGSGVLVEEEEFEYRNSEGIRIPINIYYPNGLEKDIQYPKYLQIIPYDPKYKYGFIVEPEKEIIEIDHVTIPGFALI